MAAETGSTCGIAEVFDIRVDSYIFGVGEVNVTILNGVSNHN